MTFLIYNFTKLRLLVYMTVGLFTKSAHYLIGGQKVLKFVGLADFDRLSTLKNFLICFSDIFVYPVFTDNAIRELITAKMNITLLRLLFRLLWHSNQQKCTSAEK